MSAPTMVSPDENQAILRERARLAACPRLSAPAGLLDVVEFRLGNERYAVELSYVQEVCPLELFTAVPCLPAYLPGILNLRGHILPVIDLKKFFDLPNSGIADLHFVILMACGDVELGILADTIVGVGKIPAVLQSSLPTLQGIRSDYHKGITSEQVVLLDVKRILTDPRLLVNEEV